MPTLTEQERANQQAIIDKYGAEGQKYVDLINRQKDYATGWGYDDVKAAQDRPKLDDFMNKILNVNTDAYSNASVAPDYAQLANGINDKSAAINGMGMDYQKQLAIGAQLYGPEWQQQIDRMKQEQNQQAQQANTQMNTQVGQVAQQYGQSGISGGKRNAAFAGVQAQGANAMQLQARAKQQALTDWKQKQKESLLGYAGTVRNEKIGQYNTTETANSGITDSGLINNALANGNSLKY